MKFAGICSAKNPVSPMQPNINNLFTEAGIPLFAIPFDLGQLRHFRRNIAFRGCAASGHANPFLAVALHRLEACVPACAMC
jgi:hypothetical protein